MGRCSFVYFVNLPATWPTASRAGVKANGMSKWTPQDWVTFLGALSAVIAAITTAAVSILSKLKELHYMINSRVDELVAATRAQATAEGLANGRKEGRRQEQERSLHGQELPEKSAGEILAGKHGYGP